MCRLGLFDNKALNKLGRDGLKVFLDHLEKECGGHGNGIALINDSKCTFIHKGIKYSNEQIIDTVFDDFSNVPDWFIYHTRVASKGSIKDTNCHPYWNHDKSFILAMNGTVGSFGDLAKDLDITDTELIFRNLLTFGISENSLIELTPRFIGFRDGKVFATNPDSHSGGLQFDSIDGIIIASSFPEGYVGSVRDMETYYSWHEGEEIQEKIKNTKLYNWSHWNNVDYGWFDTYYNKQKEQDKKKIEITEEDCCKEQVFTDLELMDLVDEANVLMKQGMSKEDMTTYIQEFLGTLEPLTKFGRLFVNVGEYYITIKDEIGDIFY